MADDLDDQWKLEAPDEDDTYASVQVSVPGDVKKGTKRKTFDSVDGKLIKNGEKPKKKKERLRRKITDEPEEVLSKLGVADDVRTMMTKCLKDRMSEGALEEILPDTESDFYPSNTTSLSTGDYFTSLLPNWRAMVKKNIHVAENGSPCVLVITSSAIRAVNLRRELLPFAGVKCKFAKLFSKHMKIEEQKKQLTTTKCQLGIGTPNRLLALVKLGVLKTESLAAVVLDWNWRDSKMKRLPDIVEIRKDLTILLKDHLMDVVQGSPCRIALL